MHNSQEEIGEGKRRKNTAKDAMELDGEEQGKWDKICRIKMIDKGKKRKKDDEDKEPDVKENVRKKEEKKEEWDKIKSIG